MELDSVNIFFREFSINQKTLWFIFSILVCIFGLFSLVLFYHWQKFGKQAWAIALAETVYILGAGFFLLAAVASIILF